MKLLQRLRALPRHTIPMMMVTWLWQGIAFYLPKLLIDDLPHYYITIPADRFVPFVPASAIVYVAAFPEWFICYILCAAQDKTRAYRFLCAEFLAKAICLVFFLVLPTAIVRPSVTGNSPCDWLMRLIYRFDSPTNLFPSIHCLMCWMCYRGMRDRPRAAQGVKAGLLVFALAVFVSTLTTKQHYIVDVFSGVAVAELCYRISAGGPVLRVYTAAADRITGAFWAAVKGESGKRRRAGRRH